MSVTHGPSKMIVPSQVLHDLRTPLNQIIGYSEMLTEEQETGPDDRMITDLERIGAAGHRMLALIEENFAAVGEQAARAATGARDVVAPPRSVSTGPQATIASGVLLVVDDDSTNRDVLSRRLRRQGHVVITAKNGSEALLLAHASEFDLVLLDIMMPEMDGYEVLRQMKSNDELRRIPVIMISAVSEVQSVVRCLEAGAEDYLTKPFDPILLKARIGATLEKKRGRDRETVLFDQLQKNYKRLQEVEKLRDDMRNMIVHDLRTPLTAVIMGIDMLQKHGTLTEMQRDLVDIAVSGGKTLLGMINDLLDVEKMESGSTRLVYERLSASALVASALEQVAALAKDAETTLVADISPDAPSFEGDENKLSRTLVSLLGNAIRFTGGGTVTIAASPDGSDRIRFSVRDTGNGIPAEAFGRIFEKFSQLDPDSKVGTGLGLAFCKLAVEAHGGSINVESTPGLGSTFSFSIPLRAV